jgi:hypothetical protein
MAGLETVSAEDLRQVLAEVDDGDAVQRLMAAITYKEIDDLNQGEAAELYGFSSTWASKWFNRLERLVVVNKGSSGHRLEAEIRCYGLYQPNRRSSICNTSLIHYVTARPQYVNADERAQEAFREGFKKSSPIWTTSTRS